MDQISDGHHRFRFYGHPFNLAPAILYLILILVSASACRLGGFTSTPEAVASATATVKHELPTQPLPTRVILPTPTETEVSRTNSVPVPINSESSFHSWAIQSYSDSSSADPEFALGSADVIDCSEPMLPVWYPDMDDQSHELGLNFSPPLMASQLDIHYIGNPADILKVEVKNSVSELSAGIYDKNSQTNLSDHLTEQCPAIFSLPVDIEFEVDQVIITVIGSRKPIQIDAVQLHGNLSAYLDADVFWRVPLPDTPISLAPAAGGLFYALTIPNGLYSYDVEGNQLNQFSAPDQSELTDISSDVDGNLFVLDATFGWFILMTPAGEHLLIGGDQIGGQAAINPIDGNYFILQQNVLKMFNKSNGGFLAEWELNDIHTYSCPTFDQQGRLFLLRNAQWQPELIQVEPQTGKEIKAISLRVADLSLMEIVAQDFSADENGNFYVLFRMNAGEVAIHMLDNEGHLVKRFGHLVADFEDWSEGSFFDAAAIAVSADGRFVLVADGFEEQSFLTAFILEIDN